MFLQTFGKFMDVNNDVLAWFLFAIACSADLLTMVNVSIRRARSVTDLFHDVSVSVDIVEDCCQYCMITPPNYIQNLSVLIL